MGWWVHWPRVYVGCEEFMEIRRLKENGVDLEARPKGSSDLPVGMQPWSEGTVRGQHLKSTSQKAYRKTMFSQNWTW